MLKISFRSSAIQFDDFKIARQGDGRINKELKK